MIEIGSSAGLTLLWDRYHYKYSKDMECGPSNSPVQIECELRGPKKPPLPHAFPSIKSRQGIDLNPVDLNDPLNVMWLRALIWPEHQKRDIQLEHAIELAKKDPPRIIRGDALEILPNLILQIGDDVQPCVYHSFTLSLAKRESRERLETILTQASAKNDLSWIGFEWTRESQTPLLELTRFQRGEKTEKRLAKAQPHGEWLEWL